MRSFCKFFCLFLACMLISMCFLSCKNQSDDTIVCTRGTDDTISFWGEDVEWMRSTVRIKKLEEFIPLLQKIKDHPEAIPSCFHKSSIPVLSQVEIVAMPENVPENFTFSSAEIFISNHKENEWCITYAYRAIIDVFDRDKNEFVSSDSNIYYNYFNTTASIEEYAAQSNFTKVTEDYYFFTNGRDQAFYFALSSGIAYVTIDPRNRSLPMPSHEYHIALCQNFKPLQALPETESNSESEPVDSVVTNAVP